jgi:uncharacterized membrane protein YqiK
MKSLTIILSIIVALSLIFSLTVLLIVAQDKAILAPNSSTPPS